MKRIAVVFIILALVFSFGCTGMTKTQQSTLSGAGIGAVGGGVLGAVVGVGGAAGYLLSK
jgi:hypothetical protein